MESPIKWVAVKTEIVNKWWDSLPYEVKLSLIKKMDCFNWGHVIGVSAITKYQKNELYQQVHELNGKSLIK